MHDRVTQILTNLVSNAHKYTPVEGSISVAARRDDGFVRVDVSDTGVGLSPEAQAQLFSKFFSASIARPKPPLAPGWGSRSRDRWLSCTAGGSRCRALQAGTYFHLLAARVGDLDIKCPQCGFENRTQTKFCPECAHPELLG